MSLLTCVILTPHFFSQKHYEVIFGDGEEIRSFEDRWKGGIENYIDWMRDRVEEIHRLLKPTGSFYLHCDWHASHYLKVMCDKIFGYQNFRNEIIWHYDIGGKPKHDFRRKYDTILRYSKGEKNVEAQLSLLEERQEYSTDQEKISWHFNILGDKDGNKESEKEEKAA